MHQAQLCQLANYILKMLGLWGADPLIHTLRLWRCRPLRSIPIHSGFLVVLWLRETDLDRFLLLDVPSFYSVRVTHYLETEEELKGNVFWH